MSEAISHVETKDERGNSLVLKDVLHVPNLSENLLSVGKMVEDDKIVTFDEKGEWITDKNGNNKLSALKKKFFIK